MKLMQIPILLIAALAAYGGCRSGNAGSRILDAVTTQGSGASVSGQSDNAVQAQEGTGSTGAATSSDDVAGTPLLASRIAGETMLRRTGYTVSYNATTRQPNYVAWELTPQRLRGHAKRSGSFFEDEQLDESSRAWLTDYYSSGYDRGHMCPAGDNKWSQEAMDESFLLSNMCPQRHTLNSGGWNSLEQACRKWVESSGEPLYIIAGPIFDGEPQYTRKKHRVRVPDRFFKAVISLGKGREKGIAFIYFNNTDDQSLDECATTIDHVEQVTGYDLFNKVDRALQQKIEVQNDLSSW